MWFRVADCWASLIRRALWLAALLLPHPAATQSGLAALLEADARLARISAPLLAASAPWCDATMPATGMVLHSADQYRGSAIPPAFWQGPVALAAVVPGSPAAQAGLQPGDALLAVAGAPVAALEPAPDGTLRDAAFALIARQPPGELALTIARGGAERQITLAPAPACRALLELITRPADAARTDGQVIQIGREVLAELSDDQLAALLAHELGHVVLRHSHHASERRAQEDAADRLSPHILARAGLDPQIAVDFWNSPAGWRVGGGAIRAPAYPAARTRAARIAAEIDAHIADGPAHLLALREQPFADADAAR